MQRSETVHLHTWRMLMLFTLRSPLSHISETISTTTYLNQEPIRQPDGRIEEVFAYNGNALRGALRDHIADYFLDHVGSPTISLDAFHLLYAGGAIGGTQQTNLAQARAYRRIVTPIAVLGGGIGNQVLPGKIRVSNLYPVCDEAAHLLPDWPGKHWTLTSYREMTFEKSFSRKDDSKDDRLNGRLHLPEPTVTQTSMLGEAEPEQPTRKSGPPEQMRMTAELVAAGVELVGHIDILDASEEELGCLVSGLHRFSRSPHLGGQANRGHGQVALETLLIDHESGELVDPFVTIHDTCLLSLPAERAKDAYDHHLRTIYTALVEQQQGEIRHMLGAVAS